MVSDVPAAAPSRSVPMCRGKALGGVRPNACAYRWAAHLWGRIQINRPPPAPDQVAIWSFWPCVSGEHFPNFTVLGRIASGGSAPRAGGWMPRVQPGCNDEQWCFSSDVETRCISVCPLAISIPKESRRLHSRLPRWAGAERSPLAQGLSSALCTGTDSGPPAFWWRAMHTHTCPAGNASPPGPIPNGPRGKLRCLPLPP